MIDAMEVKGILEMLIPQLVQAISADYEIPEDEALRVLYISALYELLEREDTKLWHLSVSTLLDLLTEELTTGKITFPEEA